MTRKEAISELTCTWLQRDSEFCVSSREHKESTQELRECLLALGCTEEELEVWD